MVKYSGEREIFVYALLIFSIIGVGIFSLPYIASKVGIWVMSGYFLFLGLVVTIVHLFFGELALRTPDFKRLPGFAKYHLGKKGEIVAFASTIIGIFGALLAYLIVGGGFLSEILGPIFGGNSEIWTLFYFILAATCIYFGVKAISKIDFWCLILFFSVLIIIFFRALPILKIGNLLTNTGGIKNLFLPYGPVLFSLWGASIIPELEEMLGKRKDSLNKIIIISILFVILIYLFFIFLILGISGAKTPQSALIGLQKFLGNGMTYFAFLLGFLATFTSFITLGLTLRKIFWYDLNIEKNLSWIITCFLPLILFLAGFKNFIPIISFVGGVMLGIDGTLILLMYHKIKPKDYLVYPLILILFSGIIYEIINFFK